MFVDHLHTYSRIKVTKTKRDCQCCDLFSIARLHRKAVFVRQRKYYQFELRTDGAHVSKPSSNIQLNPTTLVSGVFQTQRHGHLTFLVFDCCCRERLGLLLETRQLVKWRCHFSLNDSFTTPPSINCSRLSNNAARILFVTRVCRRSCSTGACFCQFSLSV